jgi:hypothetical protein
MTVVFSERRTPLKIRRATERVAEKRLESFDGAQSPF